jgi:hypothetical protein
LEKVIREKKMIHWWLWCEWPRNWCKEWVYDCSWIITSCLREVWLWTGRKLTTETFDQIWRTISIEQAEYGDFIIMKPDPHYANNKHLAFILEWWNGRWITILDRVKSKNYSSNARFIDRGWIEKVIRIKY